MPREHKITVYKFEELSEKAKKKAIGDYRDSGDAWSTFDTDSLTDQFKEILSEKGFEDDVEVGWSLSWSQGDGVCFSGNLNIAKYIKASGLKKEYGRLIGHISAKVERGSGRYCHWNSMSVEVFEEDSVADIGPKDWHPGKPTAALISEFESYLDEDVQKISRDLEKIGYAEIEYRSSDEQISETMVANDWEFTKDGKMWHG